MTSKESLISFIAISNRRKEILLKLQDKSMSQPELRNLTKMYKSHISRALKELLKRKLIICINPESRAFKFYKITALGKRILIEVKNIIGLKDQLNLL